MGEVTASEGCKSADSPRSSPPEGVGKAITDGESSLRIPVTTTPRNEREIDYVTSQRGGKDKPDTWMKRRSKQSKCEAVPPVTANIPEQREGENCISSRHPGFKLRTQRSHEPSDQAL